uniref:Uncharacterized protein n=1 Tax=Marseillevirus LCMAC103 TaxID=2506604 RepID=A0A481YW34_9VIRU|nr:MAG: uncharacterized protein LCMAC103_00950 [Marseillevirus LCMAC103]
MACSKASLCNLRKVVKELISDLRDHVFTANDEYVDLLFVEMYFDKLPPQELMKNMIDRVVPHADMIAGRNETFFLEHPVLFQDLKADRTQHYKGFWKDRRVTAEDKNVIWEYFDTILEIAQNYEAADVEK